MVPSSDTVSTVSEDGGTPVVSVRVVLGAMDDGADTCGRSGAPQDASVRVNSVADQASQARPRGMISR
jgi:hypothetical protein